MDLDAKERQTIESVRNHEREVAMNDLEEWKCKQSSKECLGIV